MKAPTSPAIRIERPFDCGLEETWAAWTDAKRTATRWNPGAGHDATVREVDASPGVKLRLTMKVLEALDGGYRTDTFPVSATFEIVRPPREIVLEFDVDAGEERAMRVRAFDRIGARTRMTFDVAGPLDDEPRMTGGWGACFDKLGAHLAWQHDTMAKDVDA